MEDRIKDKILDIEKYLEELEGIIPNTFGEYDGSIEKKAAGERYFEKIVEAVVDLAYLIIRKKQFNMPESEDQAFVILENKNIISQKLSKNLQNAKSMRNFIIHRYGEINNELVFNAISEELEKDIKEFVEIIKRMR